jgi:beta-galactosidase
VIKKIILALLLLSATIASAQNGRITLLFNSNWKFHRGDVINGESIGFSDNDWRLLNLPHDWSIEEPFSQEWASGTAFLPGGIGWYRKTFSMPAGEKNKRTAIYFDGVYNNSEVWINGHYLGKRPSGFVSFQYDLTPYLNFDGKNVLAVKVDHSKFADSRWYTGSGIYRNVYLVSTAPVHIGLWGVGFTTPQVSASRAQVNVNVTVVNSSVRAANVLLKCSLTDAAGRSVAGASKNINLNKADSVATDLDFFVNNPKLWSVSKPDLYKLVVTVSANGKQVDQLTYNGGIRTIKFDADKGFFLNGENMKLKGVCVHDDAGALGVAVPKEVWYRRLKTLKEGGCNSIRMSHNPHADYFYDLCDELGLLVMDESFDEWEVGKNKWIKGWNEGTPGKDGYHEYFKDWYEKDVRDMVLRDRNHASVIMWSIGNEIDYPNDPYSDPILNTGRNPQIYGKGYLPDHPSAKRLGELSKLLVDVVKKYDATRPVTAALAGVVMSNTSTFPENLDVVGYNYQEYRYKEDHKTYPKRIIYGSENGLHLSAWNAVDSNEFIAGQYLWTGIDYLGEARKWPARSSGAGILDMAGFPKPEYYFRQSLWSAKPMIYIGTAGMVKPATDDKPAQFSRQAVPNWNYKDGELVRVNCYTNCSSAELFLNGHSLGRKQLSQFSDRTIYWDVNYHTGELMVKGSAKDGSSVNYSLRTAGDPYGITATAEGPSSHAGGLSQLAIRVVDKNGLPVYSADNEVTLKISGPAKLLGLESGSLESHEDYQASSRRVLNGKLLAYIKPDGKAGSISVAITSPGLKSITVQINSQGNVTTL